MLAITAGTKLGDDGAVLLAKALESPNCKLTVLNLRSKLLSRLWKQFRTSAECHLDLFLTFALFSLGNQIGNNIISQGACAIAASLRSPDCCLEELDLSGRRRV